MSSITTFFTVIISLIIFTVIDYYFVVIRPYKKAVANLKVGDKYTYTIEEDNPFVKSEILECTIVDVQYGKDKHPYVRYEFTDGSGNTMRFDRFISQFDKVN